MKCQKCKKNEATDVHHKDKNHKNNKKTNLQFICAICHSKIHKTEPSKSKLKRLVVNYDKTQKI